MSTEDFKPTTPRAPGRKQRMGTPGTVQDSPAGQSAPLTHQPGPGAASARRQRMGQPANAAAAVEATRATATPGTRQRMGAPAPAPEAATPSSRTRMESSAPAATAQEPAPRARMGTPASSASAVATAPAGAATPGSGVGAPAQPGTPTVPWRKIASWSAGVAVVALVVVAAARWLRGFGAVQDFLATYPGHLSLPASAPEGIPAWMGWQHFLNMFFIVLIIRTGLLVRMEKRPPGYWQAKKKSFFSPHNGEVKKVPLSQWLHQGLDVLWVANGLVFIILLAVTGHWMRIVPTNWEIVPNMASAALQYASLQWPEENGWIHYNALQMVAYFATVYIAAPLAIISGVRMSTWWPGNAERLNNLYPIEIARALHFPVMLYFVAFTVVHVFLVFFTGALKNLNHMYTSRDVVDFWGLIIFLVSVVVIAAGWFLARPMFTTPLATKMGTVTKN